MNGCTSCLGRREFLRLGGVALAQVAVFTAIEPLSATASEARYPIPAADGVSIDTTNQVILARDGGKVYAFALSCPHENSALRWRARDRRFQCPKHESKYTPDGTFTSGRATRNMDRFPITKAGDAVVVDLTKVFHSDVDRAHWDAAAVAV